MPVRLNCKCFIIKIFHVMQKEKYSITKNPALAGLLLLVSVNYLKISEIAFPKTFNRFTFLKDSILIVVNAEEPAQ